MFEGFGGAFLTILEPHVIIALASGSVIGLIFGAIPGLGAVGEWRGLGRRSAVAPRRHRSEIGLASAVMGAMANPFRSSDCSQAASRSTVTG